MYCYCGDKVNYRPFSKHLFQGMQQHGGWKSPSVTVNSDKKVSYHMECKILIEASYINNINTGEKVFFAAATFEGLSLFFSEILEKL